MADEEKVEDTTEEVVEDAENTDSQTGDAKGDEDTGDEKPEETSEEKDKKIAELESTNKQLHSRLKKKQPKPKPTKESNQSDYFEEGIELIASGINKNVVKEAKVQAKDKNISLDEAMKLPIITSYSTQLETQKKSDDASLPASGKSAPAKDESKFPSGQSREDHKKAWKAAQV